jgi:hypothetical protein
MLSMAFWADAEQESMGVDEAEVQSCTDPQTLLDAFRAAGGSERKPRLLTCGYCRQMWRMLPSESRDALVTCERYADNEATHEELLQSREVAVEGYRRVNQQISYKKRTIRPPARAALLVMAAAGDAWESAREAILASIDLFGTPQLGRLRCVFGEPSHTMRHDLSCSPPEVITLAQATYEHRSFDCLPELAQALENAGCGDAELLGHLRSGGPHCRGCWGLDAVLGKT